MVPDKLQHQQERQNTTYFKDKVSRVYDMKTTWEQTPKKSTEDVKEARQRMYQNLEQQKRDIKSQERRIDCFVEKKMPG